MLSVSQHTVNHNASSVPIKMYFYYLISIYTLIEYRQYTDSIVPSLWTYFARGRKKHQCTAKKKQFSKRDETSKILLKRIVRRLLLPGAHCHQFTEIVRITWCYHKLALTMSEWRHILPYLKVSWKRSLDFLLNIKNVIIIAIFADKKIIWDNSKYKLSFVW